MPGELPNTIEPRPQPAVPYGLASASEPAASVIFAIASCDRHPSPPPPAPVVEAPAPAAAPACNLAPIALRIAMPKRAVAIGDLHGDLAAARAALRAAGAID